MKSLVHFRTLLLFLLVLTARGYSQTIADSLIEQSRFGIFGAYALEYGWFMQNMGFNGQEYWNWVDGHFEELGAHWTRSNTQLIWELIDPNLDGKFVWNIITNPDSVITNVYDSPAGVRWLGCIYVGQGHGSFRNPLDHQQQWQDFLKAVVERYNGDGIKDINRFVRVQYWQIGNEIPGLGAAGVTPSQYAAIVALSESAIHAVDPKAKICLVAPTRGDVGDEFLRQVIVDLASRGTPFDVIDIHHWGRAENYKMKALPAYRRFLDVNGYAHVEIWSCEHGTWCYQPDRQPFQSQAEQAASLVKRYVWNFANGLDKLFWNNLMEWHGFGGNPGSIFNAMGLVGDGSYCGEPREEFNRPRRSYYSYRVLAELIDSHKAKYTGVNAFHDERRGNFGYTYRDLATGEKFHIMWTDSTSAVYSFAIETEYEWINLVPVTGEGDFDARILSPGNHTVTMRSGEVFLLKKRSVTSTGEPVPSSMNTAILRIFPNPFLSSTVITYRLSRPGRVELAVYDLLGRRIRTLVRGSRLPQMYHVSWDGRNDTGEPVPAGLYLCYLHAGNKVVARSMIHQR